MDLDVKDFIMPLIKWWWLIAIATLLAAASSYVAVGQQPLTYNSTATLMIGNALENPNPSSAEFYTGQQLADTYVDVANRASVREATQKALQEQCQCKVSLPEIFVSRQNNTNLIDIIVASTDPKLAQAVAAELSRQIILRSPTAQNDNPERQAFISQQLDDYEKAITETQAQIASKRQELGQLVSARQIASVQTDVANLTKTLQDLQLNYTTLLQMTQQGATNTIRVIEPASPAWLVQESKLTTVVAAAGIGFVLAAAAAYALEFLDDTVKTPEQVTRLTKLQTLAGIAQIRGKEDVKLVTFLRPRSPISEAFRVLRTAVQFALIDMAEQTLLVTSAIPDEGKSTVAANLAVVLAQAGQKVLLIDADLRRPSQHLMFGLPENKYGLTGLLLEFKGGAVWDEKIAGLADAAVKPTDVEGLFVLPSGPIPPNPSELLGSVKMRELLRGFSQVFDFLILDSSPLLAVTDAAVLSALVGGTILVARASKSRKGLLKQAAAQLHEVRAMAIGCVLNAITPGSEGYRAYYYYRQAYDEDEAEGLGLPVLVPDLSSNSGKLRDRLQRRLVDEEPKEKLRPR